jgi:hypothetical protein
MLVVVAPLLGAAAPVRCITTAQEVLVEVAHHSIQVIALVVEHLE